MLARPPEAVPWAALGGGPPGSQLRPSSVAPSLPPQYHSKVSCFMLQQIEEPCSLGVHAAVVIPPTWILRARRPQVSPACTRDTARTRDTTSTRGHCQPPPPTCLSPMPLLPFQNTLKASKKKKRASFKRKSSKKGPEVGPGVTGPVS